MFRPFSPFQIIIRRALVIIVGLLALPIMLFWPDRARFYSYLHRVWNKTSTKPVWLKMSEQTDRFYH